MNRKLIPLALAVLALGACGGAEDSKKDGEGAGAGGKKTADGQCRYANGRTYIEQVNWCNVMHDQGVPCTVPPPPVC